METIHKSELDRLVKLNEVEAFTADQVRLFAQRNVETIEKSIGDKDEITKAVADEIRSFVPFKVISEANGHIHTDVMFIRRAQVLWDEPTDDINKSLDGVYLDTPANQKLDRVGVRFGDYQYDIQKGPKKGSKWAKIGDIREWGGKKYRKEYKKWVRIDDLGSGKNKPEAPKEVESKGGESVTQKEKEVKTEDVKKEHDPMELVNTAKATVKRFKDVKTGDWGGNKQGVELSKKYINGKLTAQQYIDAVNEMDGATTKGAKGYDKQEDNKEEKVKYYKEISYGKALEMAGGNSNEGIADIIHETIKNLSEGMSPNNAFTEAVENNNFYGDRPDVKKLRDSALTKLKAYLKLDNMRYLGEEKGEDKLVELESGGKVESSKIGSGKITVITYGGKKHEYTREDIQEMLDNPKMYASADNLPKWMGQMMYNGKMGGMSDAKVKETLEKILSHNGDITINVRSDKAADNTIKFEDKVTEEDIKKPKKESYHRLSDEVIGDTLFTANKALKSFYENAAAGNDIDMGQLTSIIEKLQKVKVSATEHFKSSKK